MFFLLLDWGCGFWEECKEDVVFHMKLLVTLTLLTWVRWHLPGFSSVKSFFPFPLLCVVKAGHWHIAHSLGGGIVKLNCTS